MALSLNLEDLLAVIAKASPDTRAALEEIARLGTGDKLWVPNPGWQRRAYESEADELFCGGSAGPGKTEVEIGLSLTMHDRSLMLRRTNKESSKMVERYAEIIGSREGWNGQEHVWHLGSRLIDISGCQHEDDKQKFKGTPHDLICFDEICDFTESQYRFIITWNRSSSGRRCRVVAAGNPPTTAEGLWVIKYWAPWLDEHHPLYPHPDGELLWFTTIAGKDTMVDGPGPHLINGEMIRARSRTFIRGYLSENKDLADTNYTAVLSALPENLRVAYKEGRFQDSIKDNENQLIPTEWVLQAQRRWNPDGWKALAMTAMAYDPAGGGRDQGVLAWRHGGWYAPLVTHEGPETADGAACAALIFRHLGNQQCGVVIDAGGGYAGATMLRMRDTGMSYIGYNGAAQSAGRDRSGKLAFRNKRAEAWWRFREELDPNQEGGSAISLPPDNELRADLIAPTFEVGISGIQVESKESLKKRLGRSPGKGDAVVMALNEGQLAVKRALNSIARSIPGGSGQPKRLPYYNTGYADLKMKRRYGRSSPNKRGTTEW